MNILVKLLKVPKIYTIRSMGVMDLNKLMKKNLSCLCSFYVDDNFVVCDSLPWT
jgi:hypothetical protein